ncbi:MAG: MarR family winged helix-turn-helix transcriptional regulator [Rubrobacteraceae bacterium]
MDPSRVTRTVQAMEREGMILRERDPEDNRVVRLYLTDEGKKLLAKSPQVNEELHRRIREVMSEEEFEELRRMLVLLAGAMKE